MKLIKKYHNPADVPKTLTEEEKQLKKMQMANRKSSVEIRNDYIIYLMNKLDEANIDYDKPKFEIVKIPKPEISK